MVEVRQLIRNYCAHFGRTVVPRLDRLPADEFSFYAGWYAFQELRRLRDWKNSRRVGDKLLKHKIEIFRCDPIDI